MKLSRLTGQSHDPDPEISGLAVDSRAVRDGFLFAALPGAQVDGADFVDQAIKNGAAAVLAPPSVRASVPTVHDDQPRRRLAHMAAHFYAGQPRMIAGVTGTNGKTSTARFAAQLWRRLGENAGSLGTLGAEAPGYAKTLRHTTPEPIELHQTLSAMEEAGVTHLAMEVSSHALAQHRADGVRFSVAAFTNLTQDHLDFHDTYDDYFSAKKRLFTDLLAADGVAVINADGEGASDVAACAEARGVRTITSGAAGVDLRLTTCAPTPDGLRLRIHSGGANFEADLPLIGAFQAENALLAAAIVMASGEPADRVLPALGNLEGAPGRMERVAEARGGAIYVDYAHTPDAVATAIKAIKPHTDGRLIVIIGAGGDRDKEKRPLMGQAATTADTVIVTDDNPRHENPAAIRAAVLRGAPGAVEIGDRAEAIAHGVAMVAAGDVLLIAGKGHETGQIIGDKTLAFNDGDVAREAAGRLS
ncbi:MAG: UDP-N-acetylmuramoyl-L-alanyl-D-glutamate--2,6-diaminopimelate ligase [Pseudomonadota bacterium]